MKKKWIEKTVILVSLAGALFLFAFFLKDVMIPLFSMQLNNDVEGAKELLISKGAAGGAAVALIEALQMVVIFIPAEFIQVTSGLSYPFYIALPLCDLGVCLGASIIFLLVRVFRFDAGRSKKNKDQIERMAADNKEKKVWMLMYLLFITPIVPFGAICYYASSTDIRYRRYILTVATGVIPSIITSNLIGAGARAFIMNALPLWVLVLIIIAMMALLFVLLWLFLDKIYFKGKDGTPESAACFLAMKIAALWRKHSVRLHIDDEKMKGIEAPFVMLCNHVSFYDFYYVLELLKDYKPAYIINHHITSAPVLRHFSKKAGMIPKKMFYRDTAAVKMLRTLRSGYPVVVFPEGRLSIDGRSSPIVESAASAYKKFGYPLVLANISGGYFTYPKWRGKFYRGDVTISVRRVLMPDDLRQMSVRQIEQAIEQALSYNASDNPVNRFHKKNKARGLNHMLYRCADCGELYTTQTKHSDLYCTACGSVHHLDDSYLFTDSIGSIPGYYDRIKELERRDLAETELKAEMNVKIFSDKKPRVRKEKGVCSLNREAFYYSSDQIRFSVPTEKIPALAFSCNKEFEIYYNNEQYYFYPVENPRQVMRWSLIIDLLREERISREKGKISD
ncbi:MAG: VTT domain-containing protein [Ruminococcus sp.]|nr:VTT domain-containing protein [Ruminococcus sp.]